MSRYKHSALDSLRSLCDLRRAFHCIEIFSHKSVSVIFTADNCTAILAQKGMTNQIVKLSFISSMQTSIFPMLLLFLRYVDRHKWWSMPNVDGMKSLPAIAWTIDCSSPVKWTLPIRGKAVFNNCAVLFTICITLIPCTDELQRKFTRTSVSSNRIILVEHNTFRSPCWDSRETL